MNIFQQVNVHPDEVWKPGAVFYNARDGSFRPKFPTKAMITSGKSLEIFLFFINTHRGGPLYYVAWGAVQYWTIFVFKLPVHNNGKIKIKYGRTPKKGLSTYILDFLYLGFFKVFNKIL